MQKVTKNSLNSDIHFSEGNIKSKGTDSVLFLTWSLPSQLTCPYATEMCKKRCFAKKNENFKNVRKSRARNFEETKKDTFVNDIIQHIEYHLQRPKAQGKLLIVRIHTSGDFYSLDYFKKWVSISNYFKNNRSILFQAYTKSMPILKEYGEIQDINIHLVWSIWCDTPQEYTESALDFGLQTFTALPKDTVGIAVKQGAFLCEGDCGNCKECYTGESKKIVIPYH